MLLAGMSPRLGVSQVPRALPVGLHETMTLLEIFRQKKWISDKGYSKLETDGKQIASMLKGLINSILGKNF